MATHSLGPENASLQVNTYREGMAARVGHDLVLAVTRWSATVRDDPAGSTIELSAEPRSLEVREGVRGVKPLTDKDRGEIRKNIAEKVLGDSPIQFRAEGVAVPEGAGSFTVEGLLTMAGTTRPVTASLTTDAEGRVTGMIPLTQSDWGIKPYRGLMGALKVRDAIEVTIEARLGGG
jgi:polyisoprenoid-binding protein YceI